MLDALRAAHQLDGLHLAGETVTWGHSQGGVAALAPASDLPRLVTALDDALIGGIFAAYAISAYAAVYDDVSFNAYVRPAARRTMRSLASRCLAERAAIASVITALGTSAQSYQRRSPTSGALGRRLRENTPTSPGCLRRRALCRERQRTTGVSALRRAGPRQRGRLVLADGGRPVGLDGGPLRARAGGRHLPFVALRRLAP